MTGSVRSPVDFPKALAEQSEVGRLRCAPGPFAPRHRGHGHGRAPKAAGAYRGFEAAAPECAVKESAH